MKLKAFGLLFTIILLILFSKLTVTILEYSALQSTKINLNYLNTQANLHLKTLEDITKQLKLMDENNSYCIDEMNFDDNLFDIRLTFKYFSKNDKCKNIINNTTNSQFAIIDIYIKSKNSEFNVSIHKRVIKKL